MTNKWLDWPSSEWGCACLRPSWGWWRTSGSCTPRWRWTCSRRARVRRRRQRNPGRTRPCRRCCSWPDRRRPRSDAPCCGAWRGARPGCLPWRACPTTADRFLSKATKKVKKFEKNLPKDVDKFANWLGIPTSNLLLAILKNSTDFANQISEDSWKERFMSTSKYSLKSSIFNKSLIDQDYTNFGKGI